MCENRINRTRKQEKKSWNRGEGMGWRCAFPKATFTRALRVPLSLMNFMEKNLGLGYKYFLWEGNIPFQSFIGKWGTTLGHGSNCSIEF